MVKSGDFFRLEKYKTIFYSYHLTNFLQSLLKAHIKLELKFRYFFTKFIYANILALSRAGFISNVRVVGVDGYKNREFLITSVMSSWNRAYVEMYLKYFNEGNIMRSIKIYSRPGRRVFVTAGTLRKMANINPGNIIFISTSAGVLNHFQALNAKIGGLLLYKIN